MDMTRYGDDESIVAVKQAECEDDSILVTDARALYDLYQRRSGAAGLDRRAQIDVAVLVTSAKALNAKIFWLPGPYMLADSTTKRLGNGQLTRRVMAIGLYGLQKEALQQLMCIDLELPSGGCETSSTPPKSAAHFVCVCEASG